MVSFIMRVVIWSDRSSWLSSESVSIITVLYCQARSDSMKNSLTL